MKVTFIMLAHEHPELCARLARRILSQGAELVVHLDLKAPSDFKPRMKQSLGEAFNTIYWAEQVSVEWGEWSMVQATLNALESISKQSAKPDYVYLLSGSDYPLRPIQDLYTFLEENKGTEFIESVDASAKQWVTHGFQEERYRQRHYFNWRKHPHLYMASIRLQKLLRLNRTMPRGLKPHLGSQWWVMTWATCHQALELSRHRDIRNFFRKTWVPDELFFQTIVRHLIHDQDRIDPRHPTHYVFSETGAPLVFHNDHAQYLEHQPFFFARKISPRADRLREALDDRLARSDLAIPDREACRDTGEYGQFLASAWRHPNPHPAWGRPGAEPLGSLSNNPHPYFLLISRDEAKLEAARKALESEANVVCHGRLFSQKHIAFKDNVPEVSGYRQSDLLIRDQDRQDFLSEIIQHDRDSLVGYCWSPVEDIRARSKNRPEWKPDRGEDMMKVHRADPNCFIVQLDARDEPHPRRQDRAADWVRLAPEAVNETGATDDFEAWLKETLKVIRHRALNDDRAVGASARNTKKKQLFLHIGVHRTGTTAIQRLLHKNRDELHRQDIHYALRTENHTALATRIENSPESAAHVVDDLIHDAYRAPEHSVIVSGEDLSRIRDVDRLAPLQDQFEVTVIMYLRRQDHWLESWYNQTIRWPWSKHLSQLTPEEFIRNQDWFHWIDYDRTLQRWARVFGQDRLVVRVFEEARKLQPFTNDFCALCGINPEPLQAPKLSVNASSPPQAVEFLRHMNLFEKQGPTRQVLVNLTTEVFKAAGLDTERHIFSPTQRRDIVAQYAQGNSEVARRFLGRENGELFSPPGADAVNTAPEIGLPEMPQLLDDVANPLVTAYLSRIAARARDQQISPALDQSLQNLLKRKSRLQARKAELIELNASRIALVKHLARQLLPGVDP